MTAIAKKSPKGKKNSLAKIRGPRIEGRKTFLNNTRNISQKQRKTFKD